MTFNSRTAFYCTDYASHGAHHRNWQEGRPTLSAAKYSPWSLLSAAIRLMRIMVGVPWLWGFKRQWGGQNRWFFLVISVAISSEPLELKPLLLRGVMKSLSDFSVTLKCWPWMILRFHFMQKSVLTSVQLNFSASVPETTVCKWMKIPSYCQRQKCSVGSLVSGDITLMRIFTMVLVRGIVN